MLGPTQLLPSFAAGGSEVLTLFRVVPAVGVDIEKRLSIVAESYLKSGFISSSDLGPDGVYRDRHEHLAFPYVLKYGDLVLASFRLLSSEKGPLPLDCFEPQHVPNMSCCEFSQLAVDHEAAAKLQGCNPRFLIAMAINAGASIAEEAGLTYMKATVNKMFSQMLSQLFGDSIQVEKVYDSSGEPPYRDTEPIYLVSSQNSLLAKVTASYLHRHELVVR